MFGQMVRQESISVLGSFLAAESCGTSGLDRLSGGAYILTEHVRSIRYPPNDHLAAVEREFGEGSLLALGPSQRHQPPHVTQAQKQAISLYFVSTFAQSELSETWFKITTGFEEWLSSWRDGLHA